MACKHETCRTSEDEYAYDDDWDKEVIDGSVLVQCKGAKVWDAKRNDVRGYTRLSWRTSCGASTVSSDTGIRRRRSRCSHLELRGHVPVASWPNQVAAAHGGQQ